MDQGGTATLLPYKFTSKELDPETGLYYFGARYYDARTSRWQSADPILDKYLPTADDNEDQNLPGLGGVFNSPNLGLYTYAHQNPVKLSDPDGRATAAAGCAVGGGIGAFFGGVGALPGCGIGATVATVATVGVAAVAIVWTATHSNDDPGDSTPPPPPVPAVSTPASPPPPDGPEQNQERPASKPLYRGGDLRARPQDVKIDPKTGPVRPTHGVSLNENAAAVERFGGARQVKSIPKELQIIQLGKPGHYEIVPRESMTFERYQQLLKQVVLE